MIWLLPVLVSAVLVFLASSAIHILSPWHKGDFPRLANEDEVMDALRPLELPPGDYMIPRAGSPEALQTPAFQAKMKRGPVAVFTVFPNGPMRMGRNLALWFVYSILVGGLAALNAGVLLGPDSDAHLIFHAVALTAFVGYAVALWQMSIWYRRSWTMTLKVTVDGLIYALITGGIFLWLWPN